VADILFIDFYHPELTQEHIGEIRGRSRRDLGEI
jgi:hypothetical protein